MTLRIPNDIWQKIIKDHQSGLSPLMISRKYGYNYETIRTRLRRSKYYVPRSNRYYENPGVKEDIFENIDTEEKAYWLGILASDGNIFISKRWQYIVQLYIQQRDEELAKAFYKFIGNKKQIRYRTRKGTNYTTKTITQAICAVSSKKMVGDLIKHGIVPRKSLVLHWPKLNTPNLYWSFVRGYWDGDGTVGKNYISVVGCESFLKNIEKFIRKELGFKKAQKLYSKWENTKTLRYSTTKAALIVKHIYLLRENFPTLERKQKKAQILVNRYPLERARFKQH